MNDDPVLLPVNHRVAVAFHGVMQRFACITEIRSLGRRNNSFRQEGTGAARRDRDNFMSLSIFSLTLFVLMLDFLLPK